MREPMVRRAPRMRARRLSELVLGLTAAAIAGCPGTVVPPDDSPGSIAKEAEPNDTFDRAGGAVFDLEGAVRLEGSVNRIGDLDVFSIGSRVRGDRIVANARTPSSSLDVSVAVFDDQGRLVSENDDRGGSSDRFLDSHVDFVVRHDGTPYFVAISHSAFASSQRIVGAYQVDVQITPDAAVPQPRPQAIFLDFDGAFVDSPVLGRFQLAPFDAGDIAAVYNGQTDLIKEMVLSVFQQNFGPFNVTIRSSDEAPPPPPFSTVYFGGFNRNAFGLSENVDLYDSSLCDDAIIYTNSFTPDLFIDTPTAEELGVAMGNVGTHEVGHLLGLNHTDDDTDLMDDRSHADAFLFDQEFKQAPLSTDIMDIGTQDGVLLLSETVGQPEALTMGAERRRYAPNPGTRRDGIGTTGRLAGENRFRMTREFLKEVRDLR